ncbi:AAA family ATPase [Gemmatimonas groenlandica]|uniref:MoxR family ATPase n=1 Tax=Gemmatimonas groenlandica TaxID=2732249 RepID=A0A6M4IZ98_9BACT|nr:MoxR family ATPase [Gemmatimonas groenlandica]QJR37551.1 MoxR family ATPase [Gemmatimonas groenlandica]
MTAPAPSTSELDRLDDGALADRLQGAGQRIASELRKVIVGQDVVVEQALIALFAGGNCLLVGVPGLAKTLLISTLARALDLKFSRIQFTPDLMPSDVTGTDVIQDDPATGQRRLAFMPGPVFANVLLADEINRTPPKTQAALLEAMQERRVTVQGRTYELDKPFFVFATQNPIELEGTYPLPEAQLDRFMLEVMLDYLPEEDEVAVVKSTTSLPPEAVQSVVSKEEILAYQRVVRRLPIADAVTRYAVKLVRTTRPGEGAPDYVKQFVSYGASVRAAQALVLGAKARALLQGRASASFEDVRALARPVLRHRVLVNFTAQSEKVTTDSLIGRLLESVPLPRSSL